MGTVELKLEGTRRVVDRPASSDTVQRETTLPTSSAEVVVPASASTAVKTTAASITTASAHALGLINS
jgi:hypothetical protein